MKSCNVQVHSEAEPLRAPAKKPWVKPSIEIIALESAEHGVTGNRVDGGGTCGGFLTRCRS